MNNPLVTIIVPVYNRADTLPRLFDSLKAQTYRPLEVILVDNFSTDNSYDVCLELAEQSGAEDFIVRVAQEKQQGAAAARNCGLDLAQGDWVSFFDSDDEMSPDFISSMLAVWDTYPDADFVATRSRMVFEDGTERIRGGLEGLSLHSHILSAALSTQSFVAQTEFMRYINGWNAEVLYWNDYELGIRMLQHCQSFVTLKRAFHRIYQHADSITGSSLSASFPKMQEALPLIENQVLRPMSGVSTRKSERALFFRYCILSGKLAAEKNAPAAKWLKERAWRVNTICNFGTLTLLLGFLLRIYTKQGGRAAWRIAAAVLGK